MSSNSIIVFGATGSVGSLTAKAAHTQGSKVYLASREPQKPIPGLTDQPNGDSFERVAADLTKPETVQAAVIKTGAKHAFIYAIFGTPNGLKETVQALKRGGVEFVVFLSSAAVRGDKRQTDPKQFIAHEHAKVECALEDIFGSEHYVAIRPGYFNSNTLRWKKMIDLEDVKVAYPKAEFDWISPRDIANVSAHFLVRGSWQGQVPKDSQVSLSGPVIMSQEAVIRIIAKVLNKDIKVTGMEYEEAIGFFVKMAGLNEVRAKGLVSLLQKRASGEDEAGTFYSSSAQKQAVQNIQNYSEKRASTFEEWVEENKDMFLS